MSVFEGYYGGRCSRYGCEATALYGYRTPPGYPYDGIRWVCPAHLPPNVFVFGPGIGPVKSEVLMVTVLPGCEQCGGPVTFTMIDHQGVGRCYCDAHKPADVPLPEPGDEFREEATGAVRSPAVQGERWDILLGMHSALRRVAASLAKGAEKYGHHNFRLGFEVDSNCLNHGANHLSLYLAGDRGEDHLANLVCNALFAMTFEDRPELCRGLLGPGGTLTEAIREDLEKHASRRKARGGS